MSGDARAPRAGLATAFDSTAASGSRRGGSRSSTSTAATSRSRTRTAPSTSSRTARSTTTASCARELERAGPPVPHALRHRGARARSTRSTATRVRASGCAGCSRSRSGTRRRRRLVLARDRVRDQAALLPRRRRRARVRVGAARAAARRDRPRRARGVPRVQLDPGAALDLPRDRASCRAGHVLVWDDGEARARALRAAAPVPAGDVATTTRPSSSRSAARGCATRCARTSSRRAGRRAALRRRRLGGARRARRRGERGAGAHVLDRLRGALVRRARATRGWSPTRYGTDHRELVLRPDAALLLPALAEAFDEPFADSSALPTYLVSQLAAEDVKVALSGEGGDELFGGYYTYAADLLAERVGAARPARARRSSSGCRRSSAKASFDYKAKRFVRAAHLPPLERHHGWKEIFSPDARAELTGRRDGFDPVDLYRDALRRDRGRRAARPAAGRRPRRLPRRRPAREDRPRVDGALARGTRAVPATPSSRTSRSRCRRGTRCAGSRRRCCCARRSSRCCRATIVHGAASAASRSRPRRGCAASSSRSRARRSRPRRCAGRATSSRARSRGCSTSTSRGARTCSRQLWGLLAFTLWHERHVERAPGRAARGAEAIVGVRVWIDMTASAHVLVFRPLVEILRGARRRGRDHRARVRADAAAARAARHRRATSIGTHGGRSRIGQGARDVRRACARCGAGRGDATSTSRSRTARTS